MSPLIAVFVFFFGTVIGSFLTAVLWRLRSGESFVIGRSSCVACRHTLAPLDLIPVLSYLMLGGRCRYCKDKISAEYIAIELSVGALFLAAAWTVLPTNGELITPVALTRLLLDWYLLATFVTVFIFDLQYMLILRAVTFPAAVIAAVANLMLGMSPAMLFSGMLVGAGIFYLQYVVSKGRWVGGGDIQLGLLIGAALGLHLTLAAILVAYVTGAMYGGALVALGKKGMKSQIPFGTFLSASAAFMLLVGDRFVTWYFGLL